MLINRLTERLGRHVSVIALFDSPTVAGLAHHLVGVAPDLVGQRFGPESLPGDGVAEPGSSPKLLGPADLVVRLQPEGSGPPWFMVHPPGGIVVCYHALAQALGQVRPFYGIRSRGLHGGEIELPARLEDMAAEYVAAVREVQPHGPYLLGGWSGGGLIAVEMAQQLRGAGESIGILALLDTTPPTAQDPDGAELAGREYGLDLSLEELARLGPDEQLPYLWQHAMRLGLVDPDVPQDVAQQVLDDLKRLFHHHMVLIEAYRVRPYPGTITLLRPADAPFSVPTARDRGWGSLAAAVDIHFVPGQHHSMVKEPHVQALARQLEDCLRRVEDVARTGM
jgi:thioesterase domain-containing protein